MSCKSIELVFLWTGYRTQQLMHSIRWSHARTCVFNV